MRFAPPTLLCALVIGAAPSVAAAPKMPPAIGCASLANLRILLRQTGADPAKVTALLADDKADHLGCSVLGREAVTALVDHAALNGSAYDCVAVRTTSVCQWTIAGSVSPAAPARRAQPDAGKNAQDKAGQDKAKQDKASR